MVSPEATIGCNVTLMQGVTIGRADRISGLHDRTVGPSPVLEDGVWVGPGAVIVGAARVGAGSRILPNAVVSGFDVPPGSMVGGVPGRVIDVNVPPDIANPI